MPLYDYICDRCNNKVEVHKSFDAYDSNEICSECQTSMRRIISAPAIHGTRDSFGVGNEFYDEKSGKVIDNWKDWEKAGFRDIAGTDAPNHIKDGAKRKKEKIEKYDSRKRFTV